MAVETVGRRMASQLEFRIRETLERLKIGGQTSAAAGNSVENSDNLEPMLQQLLSAARTQSSRLTKLETGCFSSAGAGMGRNTKTGFQIAESGGAGHLEQAVTSHEVALDGVLAALQQTREELEEVVGSLRQRYLPAGKEIRLAISNLCLSLPVAFCIFVFLFTFLSFVFTSSLHLSQQCHPNNLTPPGFFSSCADTFRSRLK